LGFGQENPEGKNTTEMPPYHEDLNKRQLQEGLRAKGYLLENDT
jgi:hypothetical protein